MDHTLFRRKRPNTTDHPKDYDRLFTNVVFHCVYSQPDLLNEQLCYVKEKLCPVSL